VVGRVRARRDLDVTARDPVPAIGSMTTPFAGSSTGRLDGHALHRIALRRARDQVGLFAVIDPPAHLANLALAAVNVHGGGTFTGGSSATGRAALIENIAMTAWSSAANEVAARSAIECYHHRRRRRVLPNCRRGSP